MIRHRPASPIHLVPIGQPIRDHAASSTCWCHPEQTYRDLATMAPCYLHRNDRRQPSATFHLSADPDGAA